MLKDITINNEQYKCLSFTYNNTEGIEHLEITIKGHLLTTYNKLLITYEGKDYFGAKILPQEVNNCTKFLVYVYQGEDDEVYH